MLAEGGIHQYEPAAAAIAGNCVPLPGPAVQRVLGPPQLSTDDIRIIERQDAHYAVRFPVRQAVQARVGQQFERHAGVSSGKFRDDGSQQQRAEPVRTRHPEHARQLRVRARQFARGGKRLDLHAFRMQEQGLSFVCRNKTVLRALEQDVPDLPFKRLQAPAHCRLCLP
ncbi:hypothetical protein G6F22_018968 [Rhizopus arrhizus]|nr:hypothetical protein G6F22_018968 [Rhizopus arrhizus]